MNHENLMEMTAGMPCKPIELDGRPYLNRYYGGQTRGEGFDIWYHHFLTADSERHLHNHPFWASSEILCGSYAEQRPDGFRSYATGDRNALDPDVWHRIIAVLPNTWTRMIVKPERLEYWYFVNEAGRKVKMKSSPPDWWKNYTSRDCLVRAVKSVEGGKA